MTGIMASMFGSLGPVWTWAGAIDSLIDPGSISINTDGSISGNNYSGAAAWYLPASGTPGNSYYVKFTKGVGDSSWASGLVEGTVYALTSNRAVSWSAPPSGDKSGTLTVSIYSDSGGTNLVGTGTVPYVIDSGV